MSSFRMAPEIREAYLKALEELHTAGKEAKPLYHYSKDIESLVRKPDIAKHVGNNEDWKPPALYASDNLFDSGKSMFGEGQTLQMLKERFRTVRNPGSVDLKPYPNEGYVRVVPKPNASSVAVSENDLIRMKESGEQIPKSDILHILNADGQPGLSEYLIRNPKAVRIFSNDKAWLPLLAGGVLGAGLFSPDSSEATMLPEVRRLMLEAERQGGKKLFHWTYNPKETMQTGIRDPKDVGHVKELHKPMGFYAAEQPKNIPGHLVGYLSEYKEGPTRLKQRIMDWRSSEYGKGTDNPILRILLDPEADVRNIRESYMHDYNKELKGYQQHIRALDGLPDIPLPLDEKTLTQHWQDLVDALRIHGVDNTSDIAEWILLNPEKVKGMFWENATWTPQEGYRQFGELKPRTFGVRGRGASRKELGLLEAPPRPVKATPSGFEPPGPGAPDHSSIFNDVPESMKGFSSPQQAIDYWTDLHKIYLEEGNEFMKQKSLAHIAEIKKYAKPGAIAAALGVGGLVGTNDADAFPLGKLRPASKTLDKMIRSEDAFYRLVGSKVRGMEVVDVLKNPNNDWRYLVLKDSKGKRYQLPMTKDYLNVHTGAKGTKDYIEKFNTESYQGKKLQALKSLTIREAKREATSHVNGNDFRAWNKAQRNKAAEIDPELVNNYSYVKVLDDEGGIQGQMLYMPRDYAEFLAQKGYVKILKR